MLILLRSILGGDLGAPTNDLWKVQPGPFLFPLGLLASTKVLLGVVKLQLLRELIKITTNSKDPDCEAQAFLQKRHTLLPKQGWRTMRPSQHMTVRHTEWIEHPDIWIGETCEYLCVCVCVRCVTLFGGSARSLSAVPSLALSVHHLRWLDPFLSSSLFKPVRFSHSSNLALALSAAFPLKSNPC